MTACNVSACATKSQAISVPPLAPTLDFQVEIESAIITTGGSVTVNLNATAPDPGIGAYTFDVVYDGSLVSVTFCHSFAGVCIEGASVGVNTIRITGEIAVGEFATGQTGSVRLGQITFQAGSNTGTATLDVQVVTLVDAQGKTLIPRLSITDGTITIS